jgi:sulfur-carrier protein
MNITVKLFASFRTGRFGEKSLDCPESCPVSFVLQELGIAVPEVGVLLVNGCHVTEDHNLAPGDTLAVFPLIGGG